MLLLNVPYAEKDEAKALGARWNPKEKSWMAPGNTYSEYKKFSKWFDGEIIVRDRIYLVEAVRMCWKCHKPIKIVCFAIEDYIDVHSNCLEDDTYLMTSMLSKMPEEVLRFVQERYNFKKKFSKTIKDSYWANCCSYCDSLQGNNYLFYEPLESPFYVDTKEKARSLTLYQIKIPFDMCVNLGATFPLVITARSVTEESAGELIKRYATHYSLNLNIVS